MNTLWVRAVFDMTLDHVNHHERPGVLPIAFSLNHCIRAQDLSISGVFLGERSVWETGGWASRVRGAEVVWEPFEVWADHHPAERAATVLGFLRRADPHEI